MIISFHIIIYTPVAFALALLLYDIHVYYNRSA